ncbi:hypothetical protein ACJJTC_013264 [Scirpophaga incertulas]
MQLYNLLIKITDFALTKFMLVELFIIPISTLDGNTGLQQIALDGHIVRIVTITLVEKRKGCLGKPISAPVNVYLSKHSCYLVVHQGDDGQTQGPRDRRPAPSACNAPPDWAVNGTSSYLP